MVKNNLIHHSIHIVLKKKALNYLIIHFGLIIFFGFAYFLTDYLEIKFPKFSAKYLNRKHDVGNGLSSLQYYFWYSAITQTTVGYGGLQDGKGNGIYYDKIDYPFQVINFLQLSSLFITPIISLII